MLYVFCGSDTIGSREKAFATVDEYQSQAYAVQRIDSDSYQYGQIQDAAGANSLFGDKTVYILDLPSTNEEMQEDLELVLPELKESENIFVLIEAKLLAAPKKKLEKYANELVETNATQADRFNTFALADALARRDKKSLWLLLNQARVASIAAEEVIGVLWWQLKSLRLAAKTKSAAEAGMKDYPYRKAKSALAKFKSGELEQLSLKLLGLYHDGHAGRRDIDLALERFVLEI